jgi:hypothetical protein
VAKKYKRWEGKQQRNCGVGTQNWAEESESQLRAYKEKPEASRSARVAGRTRTW